MDTTSVSHDAQGGDHFLCLQTFGVRAPSLVSLLGGGEGGLSGHELKGGFQTPRRNIVVGVGAAKRIDEIAKRIDGATRVVDGAGATCGSLGADTVRRVKPHTGH